MSKVNNLSKSSFTFLRALEKNNNREWFAEHKPRYQSAHEEFKAFAQTLHDEMTKIDNIEQLKVYRIYRDVRFSKDKTPYKKSLSGSMARATKWLRGGYYFHVEPGNTFVAGGFWGPNTADLKRIRQNIASNAKPLRKIINAAAFKKTFGALEGEKLKTAPRGFDKDHPDVDLLRYKQFLLLHHFTNKDVLEGDFVKKVAKVFKNMRPFLNHMSEVLTTDENGVPIE